MAPRTCATPHPNRMSRTREFLVALGAKIEGIGTNTIVIHGPSTLGPADYAIGPDHIEVGSLIGLAAVTRSPLRIARAGVAHLRSIRMGFERLGIVCATDGDDLIVSDKQTLQVQNDVGGHVPKLEDQPWPAFPADLMSIAIVTATQCDGMILMFEKMFESRLFFVDKLISMGARIVLCDPHRAIVAGPGPSQGRVRDVAGHPRRHGDGVGAMCAEGTSVDNADQTRRRADRRTPSVPLVPGSELPGARWIANSVGYSFRPAKNSDLRCWAWLETPGGGPLVGRSVEQALCRSGDLSEP